MTRNVMGRTGEQRWPKWSAYETDTRGLTPSRAFEMKEAANETALLED